MGKELEGFVQRLTALGGGSGDSRALYDDWAASYERNLQGDYGYVAPGIAVAAFAARCTDRGARILDLGCGTGLVGQALAAAGYGRIDGVDISPGMLGQARAKGVYGDLIEADLTRPFGLDAAYDAAIAVGCFGGGHVGPEHIALMIDCVRPGGPLVLYMNAIPYDADDYPAHFARLEAEGRWRLRGTERSNYMEVLDRPGWVVVAEVGG